MLGRRFENGFELSGGEWQKIALAGHTSASHRSLFWTSPPPRWMRAPNMKVFRRFAELVAGQIAFLISHRFSTVRMADRIVVLRQGAIVEQGTHDQLLALNGLYAELFRLQAEGYRRSQPEHPLTMRPPPALSAIALSPHVVESIRSAIKSTTRLPDQARVLDLGAGTGRLARSFLTAADFYVGVDSSLAHAAGVFSQAGVSQIKDLSSG